MPTPGPLVETCESPIGSRVGSTVAPLQMFSTESPDAGEGLVVLVDVDVTALLDDEPQAANTATEASADTARAARRSPRRLPICEAVT